MNLFPYASAIALPFCGSSTFISSIYSQFNAADCAAVIRDDALSYGICLF